MSSPAALRGAGESTGDFSALGWLEDLTFLAETEIPDDAPRWSVGFGFGGVLALHLAAGDERVAGVACLGHARRSRAAGRGPRASSWPAAADRRDQHPRVPRLDRGLGQGALACCTRPRTPRCSRAGRC